MSEEQEKQESQKTLVAFVAGLLIGGLLVWVFSSTPAQKSADNATNTQQTATSGAQTDTNDTNSSDNSATSGESNLNDSGASQSSEDQTPQMEVGKGAVTVKDQPAGTSVALESATFPMAEGWIGVRDYVNGQLGSLLGVVRFSKEQELVPESIILQRATDPGKTYAVVFYSDNGDRDFSLANDVQVGDAITTFKALPAK